MSESTKKDARLDKISRAKKKLRNFQEKRSSRSSSRGPSPIPQSLVASQSLSSFNDNKTIVDLSSLDDDQNGEAMETGEVFGENVIHHHQQPTEQHLDQQAFSEAGPDLTLILSEDASSTLHCLNGIGEVIASAEKELDQNHGAANYFSAFHDDNERNEDVKKYFESGNNEDKFMDDDQRNLLSQSEIASLNENNGSSVAVDFNAHLNSNNENGCSSYDPSLEDVDRVIEAVERVDDGVEMRFDQSEAPAEDGDEIIDSSSSLQMLNELSSQVHSLLSESPLLNGGAHESFSYPSSHEHVNSSHPHPLPEQPIPSTFQKFFNAHDSSYSSAYPPNSAYASAYVYPPPSQPASSSFMQVGVSGNAAPPSDHSVPMTVFSAEEEVLTVSTQHSTFSQNYDSDQHSYSFDSANDRQSSPLLSPKQKTAFSPSGSPGSRSMKNRHASPRDSPQHLGRSPSLPRRLLEEDNEPNENRELSPMSPRLQEVREQLQVHIQTIGILVSEKTDLQAQLQQTNAAFNKKRDDLEDVTGRLFASRERVTELEKVLSTSQRSFEVQESTLKYLRDDVGRLQQRLEDTTTANDDLYLHNLQLREKAQAREKELEETTEIVADWEDRYRKLELQFQRAQQTLERHRMEEEEEEEDADRQFKEKSPALSLQPSEESRSAEETAKALTHENEQLRTTVQNLQVQLHHYNTSFQNLVGERDTLAQQYQNHASQMRAHSQELEANLRREEEEKAILEEELSENLNSLDEMRLELDELKAKASCQAEAPAENVTSTTTVEARDSPQPSILEMSVNTESQSLTESLAIIRQLQSEIELLRGDNSRLNIALEEECVKADQLADKVRADEADVADRQRLLANLENDKQALSRALAQNKELKAQLAEMHDGFVHVNEEKSRVTSQLESEKHATKEVSHVLQAREEALKRLSAELEARESRLSELEANAERNDAVIKDLEKKLAATTIERNMDNETTLHLGVNQRLVDTLQEELAGAQDAINALSGQNAELRGKVVELEEERRKMAEVRDAEGERTMAEVMATNAKRDEEKINELLAQRDALADRYEDTEEKCKALRIQMETLRLHIEASTSANASMFAAAAFDGEDEEQKEENEEEKLVGGNVIEESAVSKNDVNVVEMEFLNKETERQLEVEKIDMSDNDDEIDDDDDDDEDDNVSNKANQSSQESVASMDSPRPPTSHSDVDTQTARRSHSASSSDDESTDTSSNVGDDDNVDWEAASARKKKSSRGKSAEEDGKVKKKVSSTSMKEAAPLTSVDAGVQSDEVMSVSSGSSSDAEGAMWREKYDTLNSSMEKLTQKFLSAMRQNAELEDKASRLEHVVHQLQGETETIGDYIMLYHAQRKSMKMRSEEKDAQIVGLVREKQFMQERVGELQKLITSRGLVLVENGAIIADENVSESQVASLESDVPPTTTNGDPTQSFGEGQINGFDDPESENVQADERNNSANGELLPASQVIADMNEFMGETGNEQSIDGPTEGCDENDVTSHSHSSPGHHSASPRDHHHPCDSSSHQGSPSPNHLRLHHPHHRQLSPESKKDTDLARIRQILTEMAGAVGHEAENFTNLEFYPCKCCHGRLMNV